jgi:hypothetical protein
LNNEELHNLYLSPNIIDVIRPRRMWLADIAYMQQMRCVHKLLVGKPERKRPCGRLGIDGRIILEWIL